ncbi:MAG TPA: hypothetical protein VGF73_06930 [Chthoniobacterales bacterium]
MKTSHLAASHFAGGPVVTVEAVGPDTKEEIARLTQVLSDEFWHW